MSNSSKMELPQQIHDFLLRTADFQRFAVVEYSKCPTFDKFLSSQVLTEGELKEMDDNLLYEVIAPDLKTARDLMSLKLKLNDTKHIEKDDKGDAYMGYNSSVFMFNEKGEKLGVRKPFIVWDVCEMHKNSYHTVVISTDVAADAQLILAYIVQTNISGTKQRPLLAGEDFDLKDLVFTNVVSIHTGQCNIDPKRLRNEFKKHGLTLKIRDNIYRESKKPDFFICHDSRDKVTVARPLAEGLRAKGLKIWYDEYSLEIGDSLTESIQRGLTECKSALVIISKNFLANEKWPKYELQSLLNRQISSGNAKVILPIWHGIDEKDLQQYSYYIADRVAGNTNAGIDALVERLLTTKK